MSSVQDSPLIALADARFVLEWLKQTDAPPNIIALQQRAVRGLIGTLGFRGRS